MERSVFPEINITIGDLAHAAWDGLKWFVSLPSGGYPSEYPKHPERGAAAMLDAALEPQLPFPNRVQESIAQDRG